MKTKKHLPIFILACIALLSWMSSSAQDKKIKIAEVGLPISDFSLPSMTGQQVSISGLKGKTIVLVFPRGHVQDTNTWCNICQYQYADWSDEEMKSHVRKKYNMEILFVLPYDKKTVENWIATMPEQLAEVTSWKNPPPDKMDDKTRAWMEKARIILPKDFHYEKGKVPTPLPILYDADQAVSKGLDIYRTDWGGSKVEQNMPTIIVVDKNGIVRFKYISQKTTDRPNAGYVLKFIDRVLKD